MSRINLHPISPWLTYWHAGGAKRGYQYSACLDARTSEENGGLSSFRVNVAGFQRHFCREELRVRKTKSPKVRIIFPPTCTHSLDRYGRMVFSLSMKQFSNLPPAAWSAISNVKTAVYKMDLALQFTAHVYPWYQKSVINPHSS